MQGFISYSHDDYAEFCVLKRHLKQLEIGSGFQFWCDERINAGYAWDSAINEAIAQSKVFILLISPNYFSSEYIMERELPAIRRCYRIDDALIIPVILTSCSWTELIPVPQAVPVGKNRRVSPIEEWDSRPAAFNAARAQITEALKQRLDLKIVPLVPGTSPVLNPTERTLADFRKELRLLGEVTNSVATDPQINQPELLDALRPITKLVERLVETNASAPSANLLDQLGSISRLIKRHHLVDIDLDSGKPTATKLRARGGLGNIMLSIDRVIDTAAIQAGFQRFPADYSHKKLETVSPGEIGLDTIDKIVHGVDGIKHEVSELRSSAAEDLRASLANDMIQSFSNRIDISADLTKLELSEKEKINLVAVQREVLEIERQSAAFAVTIARMEKLVTVRLLQLAQTIRQSAKAVLVNVRRTADKLLANKSLSRPGIKSIQNRSGGTGHGIIFINHRREQALADAQFLATLLSQRFGRERVFVNVRGIAPGENWMEVIQRQVAASDAMIVLIGREWIDVRDGEGRRRLELPNDFVRLEIALALLRQVPDTSCVD